MIKGGRGLYDYLQGVQAYLAPPIFVVFFLGIAWKRLNGAGCMAARPQMACGETRAPVISVICRWFCPFIPKHASFTSFEIRETRCSMHSRPGGRTGCAQRHGGLTGFA